MNASSPRSIIPGNHFIRIALGTVFILLIPLVLTLLGSGMDGDGWHWTPSDFIIMGTIIFIAAAIFDFAMMKARSKQRRIIFGAIVIFLFLWLWAELAVGVFTSWGS